MITIILLILLYLLYRFGKWLTKVSKKLEKVEESAHDYSRRLLDGVETVASYTLDKDEKPSRLESLKITNEELIKRQKIRKMIEDELKIKM